MHIWPRRQEHEMSGSATESLSDLTGEHYLSLLDRLHRQLRPKSYFEIGTFEGSSLRIARCATVAVDPNFELSSAEPIADKPLCALYRMSSDDFFATVDPSTVFGRPIDFAFLDGMHLSEFLLRDFLNTERFCLRNSVIALHDCLPRDFIMTERQYPPPCERKSDMHRAAWWTGDVWRCALLLKRRRPDLHIATIDAWPTGLMLITTLDPSSTVLYEQYASWVREMHAMSLSDVTLTGLHSELNVEPTSALERFEQVAARF
jgi:hypothetical protein